MILDSRGVIPTIGALKKKTFMGDYQLMLNTVSHLLRRQNTPYPTSNIVPRIATAGYRSSEVTQKTLPPLAIVPHEGLPVVEMFPAFRKSSK